MEKEKAVKSLMEKFRIPQEIRGKPEKENQYLAYVIRWLQESHLTERSGMLAPQNFQGLSGFQKESQVAKDRLLQQILVLQGRICCLMKEIKHTASANRRDSLSKSMTILSEVLRQKVLQFPLELTGDEIVKDLKANAFNGDADSEQ